MGRVPWPGVPSAVRCMPFLGATFAASAATPKGSYRWADTRVRPRPEHRLRQPRIPEAMPREAPLPLGCAPRTAPGALGGRSGGGARLRAAHLRGCGANVPVGRTRCRGVGPPPADAPQGLVRLSRGAVCAPDAHHMRGERRLRGEMSCRRDLAEISLGEIWGCRQCSPGADGTALCGSMVFRQVFGAAESARCCGPKPLPVAILQIFLPLKQSIGLHVAVCVRAGGSFGIPKNGESPTAPPNTKIPGDIFPAQHLPLRRCGVPHCSACRASVQRGPAPQRHCTPKPCRGRRF